MDRQLSERFQPQISAVVWLTRWIGQLLLGGMFCLGGMVAESLWAEEPASAKQTAPAQEERGPSVIHITDLYRPPGDPDDHFDLACAFALAKQGYIELVAVVIEAPKADFAGDPDVMAVAQ
ncbi:MAG TPA: hypothetical protein PK777_13540, partial [Thermoguttaceae bacterium]|nr:hypothetical protein [Thermoguttaceae bacterium]